MSMKKLAGRIAALLVYNWVTFVTPAMAMGGLAVWKASLASLVPALPVIAKLAHAYMNDGEVSKQEVDASGLSGN